MIDIPPGPEREPSGAGRRADPERIGRETYRGAPVAGRATAYFLAEAAGPA